MEEKPTYEELERKVYALKAVNKRLEEELEEARQTIDEWVNEAQKARLGFGY